MKYVTESHRNAEFLLTTHPNYINEWQSVERVLGGISDKRLINHFKKDYLLHKSISATINDLLKEDLVREGWAAESAIFQDDQYRDDRWRLDFVRGQVAIEVAFNHGEATAWNLIKPVLSGEQNHVKKAIQTSLGIIITATDEMKAAGGFDSAVGTYEKFQSYLKPMMNILTVPILLIGLTPPETFLIEHKKHQNGRKYGEVREIPLNYRDGK
ncbi:MAG TPA: BglII/BstYI family type II restriction endonuclease [bacterium]|nr:BglII/BstYI family type II restriction endonuclease [bacterium]